MNNLIEEITALNLGADTDQVINIIKEYQGDLFSELRGLLKENAQFPEQWDTDQELMDWLMEKGEY